MEKSLKYQKVDIFKLVAFVLKQLFKLFDIIIIACMAIIITVMFPVIFALISAMLLLLVTTVLGMDYYYVIDYGTLAVVLLSIAWFVVLKKWTNLIPNITRLG